MSLGLCSWTEWRMWRCPWIIVKALSSSSSVFQNQIRLTVCWGHKEYHIFSVRPLLTVHVSSACCLWHPGRQGVMRPCLMFRDCHLKYLLCVYFLQRVAAFPFPSLFFLTSSLSAYAHILAFQSQCGPRSPLKWSHGMWQLCEWNKISVRLHLPLRILSAIRTKKGGALTFPEVPEHLKGNFKQVTE